MTDKDFNKIAKVEKAIRSKYGDDAIQNPKKHWDEEKERRYLEDLKLFYKKSNRSEKIREFEGLIIKEKKILDKQDRTCPVCGSYSFSTNDDIYMVKFECCFECYIQHVEGREERWKSGWRPNI